MPQTKPFYLSEKILIFLKYLWLVEILEEEAEGKVQEEILTTHFKGL